MPPFFLTRFLKKRVRKEVIPLKSGDDNTKLIFGWMGKHPLWVKQNLKKQREQRKRA